MIETIYAPTLLPQEFVVSTLSPVDIDQMHAEYIANGGQLNKESFCFIMNYSPPEAAQEPKPNDKSIKARISQVRSFERYTGIQLSKQEEQLYIVLRDQLITCESPKDVGYRPQALTDQRLMAEILLLTSPAKMVKFMGKYPSIFSMEEMVVL